MDLLTRDTGTVEAPSSHRTVTVRLCRWSTPRPVVDPDGTRYREEYEPGSLTIADNCHVVDTHTGALIGRADPDTLTDDDDGPTVELTIARTAAGNDVLAQLDARVIRSVSMELEPVAQTRAGDLVTRTRALVHGVAFAFRPQLDAPVLAVRAVPDPLGEPMTDTAPVAVLDPSPAPVIVNTVDAATLDRAIDDLRRELITRDGPAAAAGHPAARFRSLDEFATAAWSDPSLPPLLNRALADQIAANNPGVIPPAWLSTVFGIVDFGRPTVTAFGTRPLPDSGMEVDWPYFDGDLTTLVGKQTAEKTPITSVRVDLKRASVPLDTYAGGSDLSYQLIRRSSPSYREAYIRIMMAAYAAVTNVNAVAAAVAVAGPALTYDATTDTDGKGLAAVLFEASSLVEGATGSPASFATAATDVFVALGGKYLPPGATNTAGGTATASTLTINVSGLTITHDPYLADGKMLVSNRQAGGWYEDGPFTITAEDVEKLGQNVAVWGMGAFGATAPQGIVDITVTLAPVLPLDSGRSSRSK